MVINAENINEPSHFSVETTTDAEMAEDILFMINMEKPSIIVSSSISWAVEPIVAKASATHACGHKSLVPSVAKPKRSASSQDIRPVL